MQKEYLIAPKGKFLFIVAGIICLFTIIGIPVAFIFFYMASRARIILTDDAMIYAMLKTKTIPYNQIETMKFLRSVSIQHVAVGELAYVVPLQITWGGGRKTKFSLNFFQASDEIAKTLVEKTGKQIEVEQGPAKSVRFRQGI